MRKMEDIDFFLMVTAPIILTLIGVIITLVISHFYERSKFGQLPEKLEKLNNLQKLDKLDEISDNILELRKDFDDSVKATFQDLSKKFDKVLKQFDKVLKLTVDMAQSQGNPDPNPTSSEEE